MEGFKNKRFINTFRGTDPVAALQHCPAHLKKYADDIEGCLLQIETLKRLLENSESEHALLKYDIRRCENECKRYRMERDEARQVLRNFDEFRHMRHLDREVNGLGQDYGWKTRERDAEVKRYRTLYEDNNRKRKIIQYLDDKIKQRDFKIKTLEGRLNNPTERTADGGTSKRTTQGERDKQLIFDLREQLQQAAVKLKERQAELDETKARLSKVMGDKLTDNNPNIADLSDRNRPIKLAERYAELYDNQWTDAFEVVYKYFQTEEQTIGALTEILKDVMDFCNKYGKTQMEDLQRVMAFSDNKEHGPNVSKTMLKQLKDCRKAMSSVALTNLYKMYISSLNQSANQTLRAALDITPFVKECVEICWLMVVQDPPVVFAAMAQRGSVLNTNLYKPYTSSGIHVDYVVWPTLLLHEDGPVLAKGVAQGYRHQVRRTNLTPVNGNGTVDEKTYVSKSDAQNNRYRQGDSNSAQVDKGSRNSSMLRDDSQRYQRVATVGPMRMENSSASK